MLFNYCIILLYTCISFQLSSKADPTLAQSDPWNCTTSGITLQSLVKLLVTTWNSHKILTQPLGTQKSFNLSEQRKSHNLSGQKNHATSWDKKKSNYLLGQKKKVCNLLEQKKSRNRSGQKKIKPPFRTKKLSIILGPKQITQPFGKKNHAIKYWYNQVDFYFHESPALLLKCLNTYKGSNLQVVSMFKAIWQNMVISDKRSCVP